MSSYRGFYLWRAAVEALNLALYGVIEQIGEDTDETKAELTQLREHLANLLTDLGSRQPPPPFGRLTDAARERAAEAALALGQALDEWAAALEAHRFAEMRVKQGQARGEES